MVHEIVEYDMNYHSFLYLLTLRVSLHKPYKGILYISIEVEGFFFAFLVKLPRVSASSAHMLTINLVMSLHY